MSDPTDTSGDTGTGRRPYGVGPAYPSRHTEFTSEPPPSRYAAAPAAAPAPASPPAPALEPTAPSAAPVTGTPGAATGPAWPTAPTASSAPAGSGPATEPEPSFTPTREFTVADGVRDVGLVFIGASMTAGYGDPKGLGWVGRVVARTQHPDLDLTAYNLGVRGNTSGDVVARWGAESHPRWKGRGERRLVVSVGAGDITSGMTMARSRLNLANVLDEATNSGIGVFVVGLTPTLDAEHNRKIEALAEAQADVCARRGITYVDCFRPLVSHDQWMADLAASPDRVHPGQAGYGLVAWLVLHNGWNDWLAIS
ncbi:GDSL-type esterase/lipase family protein [Humibacillus xanthopallidus]|uniref:Lysophospholipase L1-like esterase n=1 Tax=Humibacillus xanthopallidus TaxID=412689 RepID=A0A543HVN5_9MICO|nr:GDSL-type esterase/lipase family protein [Humibacillus xanthopallidus]TQM62365.1 lysophospholipase L1-like esterase [Humibacillus xanthopallidus]